MRSYKGKEVNVSQIVEQQAKTLSAGNMRVNARGDLIGAGGKILKTREQLENEYVDRNPNAAIQKKTNLAGFNKGIDEYADKVLESEATKPRKVEDPFKETSKENKNLITKKNEKVKFSDTTKKVEETSLNNLPLEDDFEISDNPEPNKEKK
jgi:hypothetical protein